jgi:D-threonate/D-erythronate kinase
MAMILAIADDLTGALETGAKFAGRGVAARVVTMGEFEAAPETPVLVIDTETRHLSAGEAAGAVRRVAAAARRLAPSLVYKKTDSTLRGNIAAEFGALREVFPELALVFVPAYPEMGRTVRGGRLYVHGVPVHETSFAADPLNPILESEIARVLAGVTVSVVDGETSADVEAAARAIAASAPLPLAAGPAALAEALAGLLELPRGQRRAWPRVERCLLVNGSMHPVSAAQVAHARAHGWRAARPGCAPGALARGGWYVLDAAEIPGAGLDRAGRVGAVVRGILEQAPVDALVVFGGDTAYGIHAALRHPAFDPYGELVPGVPLSRCGGRFWITKAGGFGPAEILCDIQRLLT